ncbi:hypothetical protein D3C83_190670 [compost metagenome]
MNNSGVFSTGRRPHRLAIQAKICTPLAMAIIRLAPAKKYSDNSGSPVVYMWWTHSPKLRKPVPTAASTIHMKTHAAIKPPR